MREYVLSMTRILPYKDKIYDFVYIRENTGQWKSVFSHVLCSGMLKSSKIRKFSFKNFQPLPFDDP